MTGIEILLLLFYGAGVALLARQVVRAGTLLVDEPAAAPPADIDARPLSVDVLIPVKDEERNIAACIRSVLAQDYPLRRVIVVNDRSTDGTARAVQEIQDVDPRVQRVDIDHLPPGLYGKPHGLSRVAGQLQADVVVFVDSDMTLEPSCVRAMVNKLSVRGLDWLALIGRPNLAGFWERLVIPVFGAVTFAWFDPRKVSDPASPIGMGSGLMAARRSSYEAIGGHAAVVRIYDEDSELIRIAKRAGQRVEFGMAADLLKQRHYGTLERTIRGVTRTIVGGLKTLPRIWITIAALYFVSILPIVVLAGVAAAAWSGVALAYPVTWTALGGIHLLVSGALARRVYRTVGGPWYVYLLSPLGVAVMIYICLRAAVHLRRGEAITWRGTTYPERTPAPGPQ